ncbi:MAG: dienelactone hydrolase family protein [Fimbriimonadaceae bacterium]
MSDPFEYLRSRLAATEPSLAWRGDVKGWADAARGELRRLVGVVDEAWPGDDARLEAVVDVGNYTRRWVSFPSREGWDGSGWLLTPESMNGPTPAVICLPGHGAGADALVGLVDEPYQANFALQCVKRGWVALAVEQVSFGHNMSADHGEDSSSCLFDTMFALELGETMTGWRVRDAMAAARCLRGLPEVDGSKIATLGISGGGLTALWTAALDESICAAGVSGYFTPMAHSILRYRHCSDNYIPGLAQVLDVPDLAGLIAPRWLAVENGTEDHIFAIEGFRLACERAREIYGPAGCPMRFTSAEYDGGHTFKGYGLLEHLAMAFAN